MKRIKINPVILCGGSGTRLWPLSRSSFPKQFLSIIGKNSFFQEAINRALGMKFLDFELGEILIVTSEENRFLVLDQLSKSQVNNFRIILEPNLRNTAPALTFSALEAFSLFEDSILVVMPSDHLIDRNDEFIDAIHRAIKIAWSNDAIVTLGIPPNRPETGYGYIEFDYANHNEDSHDVKAFYEKPDLSRAKQYLESKNFLWNAGVFICRANLWLGAMNRFMPIDFELIKKSWELKSSEDKFVRPAREYFESVENISIDYAVIEKAVISDIPVQVIPLDCGWSDIGSWSSVFDVKNSDVNGNVMVGNVVDYGVNDSLIYSTGRVVGALGVSDLAIIETPDAVLVANLCDSQNVKKIIEKLDSLSRPEIHSHRKVFRPWGWYDSIDEGPFFKVKRIQVKPGASLSLQKHEHRAEHWVVVSGIAQVQCNSNIFSLKENESTYIPLGAVHRLSNHQDIPLELIEVQTGAYLGEDDIVRLEDFYGR